MGFQVLSNSYVCSQEIGGTREEMQLSDSDWRVFSTNLPHLSTDYLQALYELSAGSLHIFSTYPLHCKVYKLSSTFIRILSENVFPLASYDITTAVR